MVSSVPSLAMELADTESPDQDAIRGVDLAGTTVGEKYKLSRLLGRGGMGVVYEARNTSTEKRVAVKLLTSAHIDRSLTRRFFREAKASSVAEGDHVVSVYDSRPRRGGWGSLRTQ